MVIPPRTAGASDIMAASIATLVSVCVCALHVLAHKYPVTFEDVVQETFSSRAWEGTWIARSTYMYDEGEEGLYSYNLLKGDSNILLNKTVLEKFNVSDISVSADGKWLALEHNKHSVFRHSTTCLYTLIENSTKREVPIGDGKRVQLLVWAPEGSGVAFVIENDIYYQSEEDRRTSPATYKRITNSPIEIYNGVADWVYEEEVLESSKALWFSPSGMKLVFATMNDTKVRNVTFWKYGDPSSLESQYVKPIVIKYPKVGTRNPVAYLNYVDLQADNLNPIKLNAPEDLVTSDNILAHVSWAGEDHFSVTWMERLQTTGYTLLCPTEAPTECKVVYTYKEENGWLDIEEPVWLNTSTFVTVLPQDVGNQLGNYRQLCIVQDGKVTPITSGISVVKKIDCVDRKNNIVYFTSTVDGDSAKKLVYKVNLNEPEHIKCHSCSLRKDCVVGTAYFSTECELALLTCRSPSVPVYNIYSKIGGLIEAIGANKMLSEMMVHIERPKKMDLEVPVGEFNIRVRLLLPPHMDQSGRTKYPVLFNVYSGPDSNKISDSWSDPGWDDYLVTKRQIIIVNLDGRGSGLRGDKLKFAIYHQLGGPEIDDILIVGKHLQETYPFVDPLRTAIWGWSYGGFATAMALAKDSKNIFRCGISVAPVTNWIYYDTVYTERYMGLPTHDSNLDGYLRSSVSANVTNFRDKLFYLIHGNADDNVHYQQSMMLSRALELADILFFQQSYPDETHSLSSVRRHLYHSMDKFWTRCFHLNASDIQGQGFFGTPEFSSIMSSRIQDSTEYYA